MTDIDKTLKERGSRYGDFAQTADTASHLESVLYSRIKDRADDYPAFTLHAISMIAVKLARIVNGDPHYEDNWHDIAGYCKLVQKELQKAQAVHDDTEDEILYYSQNTRIITNDAYEGLQNLARLEERAAIVKWLLDLPSDDTLKYIPASFAKAIDAGVHLK